MWTLISKPIPLSIEIRNRQAFCISILLQLPNSLFVIHFCWLGPLTLWPELTENLHNLPHNLAQSWKSQDYIGLSGIRISILQISQFCHQIPKLKSSEKSHESVVLYTRLNTDWTYILINQDDINVITFHKVFESFFDFADTRIWGKKWNKIK